MFFLLKQLTKEPLALVKSLHGNNQSFEEAKLLLQQAFASPVKQKHDIIHKLRGLNLTNANLIYTYISDIRTIIQTFDRLEISVNDIIRHFIWASMPKLLQDQFVSITNTNHPTLTNINENLFDAAERFNNIKKVNVPSNVKSYVATTTNDETISLAAHIPRVETRTKPMNNSRYRNCVLCTDANKPDEHPIHQCPNFVTNRDKIEKLSKMKACISCGYANHIASDCHFRF